MAKKKLTSLDSLMIFTGVNANKNALALENREYGIYKDEFIGELQMTKTLDSAFAETPNEIFVETTPHYKSIKDITSIAYSYIVNKLSVKEQYPVSDMYIDNNTEMNFRYYYEKDLNQKIDNAKKVPFSDILLYLRSLNNSLYNKQKYYSKSKEITSISNNGIKYEWMPEGTKFELYDDTTYSTYEVNVGNDFLSYEIQKVPKQVFLWDEESGTYIGQTTEVEVTDPLSGNVNLITVPLTVNRNVLNYKDSYFKLIENKLSENVDLFSNKYEDKDMLSYYLYNLNSHLSFVMNTYSFGQKIVGMNLNFDGEFNNWFHNVIKFNVKDLTTTDLVSVVPGEEYRFNLALNENERFIGDDITGGSQIDFRLPNLEVNSFNGITILSPYKLKRIDFSAISDKLEGELDLLCKYDKKIDYKQTIHTDWNQEKGNMLEELIIGKEGIECKLTSIKGLEEFKKLKKVDLTGCTNLTSNPDLSILPNIKDIVLKGSNISVFNPSQYSVFNNVSLSDKTKSIILNDIKFNNPIDYEINENLTTLELNNVKGLDTQTFISEWIAELERVDEASGKTNRLNTGWVNYVNINGANWDRTDVNLLYKLKQIELNEFTGTIRTSGISDKYDIYRNEYQELIRLYGNKNINNPESNLNIKCDLGKNAYKVNFRVDEEYEKITQTTDEYGQIIEIKTKETRLYKNFKFTIQDTITGNSLLNFIDKHYKKFYNENFCNQVKLEYFINNNKLNIGYKYKLPNNLTIPKNTELITELNPGDILLFTTIENGNRVDSLVFITKEVNNVNQNFIKLGTFDDRTDFVENYVNHTFELNNFVSLDYLEDEILAPVDDEENTIIT